MERESETYIVNSRLISRRRFLELAAEGMATAAAVASGLGILITGCKGRELSRPAAEALREDLRTRHFNNTDQLISDFENKQKNPPDLEEANHIRGKIADFEDKHANTVDQETINQIFQYSIDLCNATFGRGTVQSPPILYTNEELKKTGLHDPVDVPQGDSSGIIFVEYKGKQYALTPMRIFLGDPRKSDPDLNKLSLIRGLILHEMVHRKTAIRPLAPGDQLNFQPALVKIGDEQFYAYFTRGFKWITDPENGKQKAYFFDEINTQLLAAFINDPTEQDPLYQNIVTSPLYRNSLSPHFYIGADLMKELYRKLGISIEDLEKLHLAAQPEVLLAEIDRRILRAGFKTAPLISSFLINLDPPDPQSDLGLEGLKKLVLTLR